MLYSKSVPTATWGLQEARGGLHKNLIRRELTTMTFTLTRPHKPTHSLLYTGVLLGLPFQISAADNDFFNDATATLQARNYYFSRDFSDIVGANQQSKSEEWAHGFILTVKSGYTPGSLGFGVDVLGQLGFKLDSSSSRVNTGLLPTGSDGKAADNFGRIGAALKARLSKTELKIGELTPNLPVLTFRDMRLLPPTYQGPKIGRAPCRA